VLYKIVNSLSLLAFVGGMIFACVNVENQPYYATLSLILAILNGWYGLKDFEKAWLSNG
jgi:hypothetical protein